MKTTNLFAWAIEADLLIQHRNRDLTDAVKQAFERLPAAEQDALTLAPVPDAVHARVKKWEDILKDLPDHQRREALTVITAWFDHLVA